MGDLREPSIGAAEERPVSSPPSCSNPSPCSIGLEHWTRAEEATQRIIGQVQPTAVSEERRREVIDYVQRLIRGSLGFEVFPFGSVPLKTYLPDGDIDLTAFGGASIEEALVNDVVSVLEAEDQNMAAEFIVKDVQLIRAEVKLVKCIIQNIVVDISFNQLGGLCTLCFLEQVDRLIGKDHLFKRSIILIKAWCYYESRILGAHHGLISTYALETLVLYIFHLFHSNLNGPLAVLYRFLDYFSKFDWDNYCVSLTGPVRISSLPEILAEKPESSGSDLLLSNDFHRYCADMFSVPSRGVDTNSRTFPQKHLNIVDPLKENNNLGRSVSKGNFFRIRSAFAYGARKLGRILLQPEDNIADELDKFFSNTLDRHGSGQRPDVQDLVPIPADNGFVPALSFSENELSQEEMKISGSKSANSVCLNGALYPNGLSHNKVNDDGVLGVEMKIGRLVGGHQKGATEVVSPRSLSEADGPTNITANIGSRFYGDAEDLLTSKIDGKKLSNGTRGEQRMSQRSIAHQAPPLYFADSGSGNGKFGDGNSDLKVPEHSYSPADKISSVKVLSDLSGDYNSHLNSLQYGRLCYEQSPSGSAFLVPPALPLQFQTNVSLDAIRHSYQFKRNGFHSVNANGAIPRQNLYRMNPVPIPGGTFGVEEMPKPRGTGTYFPNVNQPPYWNPLAGRGRNRGTVRSPHSNNRWTVATPMEGNFLDNTDEVFRPRFTDQGNGKPGPSVYYESDCSVVKVQHDVNVQAEGVVEFGSVGHLPLVVPSQESSRQPNHATLLAQAATQSLPTARVQNSEPVLGMNRDRVITKSSYHLKDEDDFPPLCI